MSHTRLLLREDGIIQINGSNHKYTVGDIISIQKAVRILSKNNQVRILIVGSEYTEVDQDAMKYMSSPVMGRNSKARAFVIKSLAQRIIINFIVNIKGAAVPAKFFTEKNQAISWLKAVNN
jgi:hypothetical protein